MKIKIIKDINSIGMTEGSVFELLGKEESNDFYFKELLSENKKISKFLAYEMLAKDEAEIVQE